MADLRALKQIQDDREKKRQSALTQRLGTNARDAVGQIVSQNKIVPQFPATEEKTTTALDVPKAESTAPDLDTAVEPTEYEKAYQKQLDYMKQYMNRGPFEYDVNADELYKRYQKQTLDAADKARRDATAQAAGLTGGYGSTYAAAVGENAYNAQMQNLDALRPALYEAALSQYQNEGQELLDKASVAGEYAAMLESQNQDYTELLSGLFGGESEAGKRVKYTAGSNNGITPYDDVVAAYKGNKNITDEELRKELVKWTYAANDKGYNEPLSADDIEYLISVVSNMRAYDQLGAIKDKNGTTLEEFINSLTKSGKDGGAIYDELVSWKDANGDGLTESELATLLNYIIQ